MLPFGKLEYHIRSKKESLYRQNSSVFFQFKSPRFSLKRGLSAKGEGVKIPKCPAAEPLQRLWCGFQRADAAAKR